MNQIYTPSNTVKGIPSPAFVELPSELPKPSLFAKVSNYVSGMGRAVAIYGLLAFYCLYF